MTRKKLSVCYKMFVIFSLIIGVFANIINTKSMLSMISYYTIQSNIVCIVAFIAFEILEIIGREYKNDNYYKLKGAIIVAILITLIVYRFALAPIGFEMDALKKSVTNKAVANFFVHNLSPILVIGDYILFDEKGNFKFGYPLFWLIIPLSYVIYVYIYSSLGGRFYSIGGSRKYAYFFLDYEKLGWYGVGRWVLLIALAILGISYLYVFIDNKWGKRREP